MMSFQTVTLSLPEKLYQSAYRIAEATNRPIEDVVRESLTHTLPPLDDLDSEDIDILLRFSSLDDATLWTHANAQLPTSKQSTLNMLLEQQSADGLGSAANEQLQTLMEQYGQLLVQKSHAWLLLARRGYKVPTQKT